MQPRSKSFDSKSDVVPSGVPTFGVSSKYLRAVLDAFSADVVTLRLDAPGSPIHVSADSEGEVPGVVLPNRILETYLSRTRLIAESAIAKLETHTRNAA